MKNILIIISIFGIGFLIGRCSDNGKVKTEYIKGDPIENTIIDLIPYTSIVPSVYHLPFKEVVTKDSTVIQVVDTAQIIASYVTKNRYKQTLFDNDKEGVLKIDATVQYNNLQNLTYKFTPITMKVTETKNRKFTPFVTASMNTFNYIGAGGGLFINEIGVSAKYLTNFENKGAEIGLLYKF